jgi:prepilin-type processing-associated H-X9-DG protein
MLRNSTPPTEIKEVRVPVSLRRMTAFTLVELLVVISILALLIALLLPAIQAAREAARRVQCTDHIRQQGLAVVNYEGLQRHLPSGRMSTTQFGESWAFRLLPFLEESAVYEAFDESKRVDSDANAVAMRTPVSPFHCPSRRLPIADRDFDNNDQPSLVLGVAAGGDYAAAAGLLLHYGMDLENDGRPIKRIDIKIAGPIFTYSKIKIRRVLDGMSKTVVFGERHIPPVRPRAIRPTAFLQGDTAFFAADNPHAIFAESLHGLASGKVDRNGSKFGSLHPDTVQFVFLDGHVESFSAKMDDDTLKRLTVIADGGQVPEVGKVAR